jgi:hypothetical protein
MKEVDEIDWQLSSVIATCGRESSNCRILLNSTPMLIGSFGFSLSGKNSLGAVDQSPIAWQLLKGCRIHKKLGASLCHA